MNDELKSILNKDSLDESEKMLGGKHWSQLNELERCFAMSKFVADNDKKRIYLTEIGDTYFSMTWDYFKDLIKQKGFINGYTYEFNYQSHGRVTKEEIIIYYHPQKGLVIYAESYDNKTSVNGGDLYGEVQANNEDSEEIIWKWISTGGCIDRNNRIYSTQYDIREGLFSKLAILESAGKFLTKWVEKNKFLWFVDD